MAYRIVQQSLWTDEKVMDLYSCEDKYFWLYLLTNPQSNQLGIYKLPIKLAAFQLGYSSEQVVVLLDRFEKVLKQIKYNRDTQEVAIAYFLNHSIVSGGAPVMSCINKDLNNIKELSLIDYVVSKMEDKTITNDTVGKILELLKEKSNKKENNKKHNNNNKHNNKHNSDTYHESYDESYHDTYHDTEECKKVISNKNIIPPTVEMVKEYCLERKNNINAESFVDFYSSKGWLVGKNKMKDWQAAIRTWEKNPIQKNNNSTSNQAFLDKWKDA